MTIKATSSSSSLPINLIEHNGACAFSCSLDAKKILNVYLAITQTETSWEVSGNVLLKITDSVEEFKEAEVKEKKAFTYKISPFLISKGQSKWIGSWDPCFEKSGVSVNCATSIPPEEFDKLANQTLIKITAFSNGILIDSDYLQKGA